MRITKPLTLGLLSRPYEFRRAFHLSVAVTAFLPVGDVPTLLQDAAMWTFLGEELPPDQPLDAVMPKAQAEFLAVTRAFAPGGKPAPWIKAGIQLGSIVKQLTVFGDRTLPFDSGGQPASEPVPFTVMPIGWPQAYGGEGYPNNPAGKGFVARETERGRVLDLPNVLDPKQTEDGFRHPAGFGAIDQMWPARAQLVGMYDDAWLQNDFPGLARDMDWRFFNVAPRDQWFPGMMSGTETYAFNNLHPERPLIKGRLPGMAPRLFIERAGGAFEEVGLALTTVWFFPHRDRVILVHHGSVAVQEEDASDVVRVVIGADPQGQLRPEAHYHAVMEKRIAKGGGVHAMVDADLVPAAWLAPDPMAADMEARGAVIATMQRRRRLAAGRNQDQLDARLQAGGIAPAPRQPAPVEQKMPALEDVPALAERMRIEAEARAAEADLERRARDAHRAPALAAAGLTPEVLAGKPKGPPGFTVAGIRAQTAHTAQFLRGIGAPNLAMEASLSDPAVEAGWRKTEQDLRNIYRLAAENQAPADRLPEAASARIREILATDTQAARAMYDLHGANLAGLSLADADLSGVCLDGADLAGTDFSRAHLSNCVLAHSDMAGARLDGADLSGANLAGAKMAGASLVGANLHKTTLTGADLTDADLSNADLRDAKIGGASLLRTRLAGVNASKIIALEMSLAGLRAPGITLDRAKFLDCDLSDADFTGASLLAAVFIRCNLTGAKFTGARMANAVFVDACVLDDVDLMEADLSEANLRGMQLRRARMHNAIIDRADFSGADLTGAFLLAVRGVGSRFVAANLTHSKMMDGNFAQADLSRADLGGSDMRRAGFYEANLSRVKRDTATRADGIFTRRMRFLPRLPATRAVP